MGTDVRFACCLSNRGALYFKLVLYMMHNIYRWTLHVLTLHITQTENKHKCQIKQLSGDVICKNWVNMFKWDFCITTPDGKVHETNMGPTWVLPVPYGHHVGPLNLAISDAIDGANYKLCTRLCDCSHRKEITMKDVGEYITWMP